MAFWKLLGVSILATVVLTTILIVVYNQREPAIKASAVVCPTLLDANNESSVVVGCDEDGGCSGFVEWCDLANTTYRFTLNLAGDYNLVTEFLTLTINGNSTEVSASGACGDFEEVFSTTVEPVGGVIRMDYINSPEVGSVCDDTFASALLVVLKQL